MNKTYIKQLVILSVLLICVFAVKQTLLGGTTVVRLKPAPALAGQVSQALLSHTPKLSVPVPERDFKLQSSIYFENKDWAVVQIVGLNNVITNGTAVIHIQSGTPRVVLGPGTAFANSYVRNLPDSVAGFLRSQGVVYDSVN